MVHLGLPRHITHIRLKRRCGCKHNLTHSAASFTLQLYNFQFSFNLPNFILFHLFISWNSLLVKQPVQTRRKPTGWENQTRLAVCFQVEFILFSPGSHIPHNNNNNNNNKVVTAVIRCCQRGHGGVRFHKFLIFKHQNGTCRASSRRSVGASVNIAVQVDQMAPTYWQQLKNETC